jgi:hypothetical protein
VTRAPAAPVLVGLDAAGTPAAWRAAGFAVDDAGTVPIGDVRVAVGVGGRGISAWTLSGVPPTDSIDGLPTRVAGREPAAAGAHPNGASIIDHLVVWSDDDTRTIEAFETAGFTVRRVREDARPGYRQTFLRAGEVIVELVAPAGASDGDGRARFFGIAVTVTDLDGCATLLGDALGPIRDAVQPGRRIATLRGDRIGLPVPVAFMSA